MMIGVHTPEFAFEQEIGNVKYAVKKHGITWPVLNDSKRSNWENYGNTYWPRTALIDSEGLVILEHVGESGYDEIERKIREELIKLRELPVSEEGISEEKRVYSSGLSRETYAGSARNNGIGSAKVCSLEGNCNRYLDEGRYKPGVIYLHGDWIQEPEYVEYLGKEEGWIAYQYYAQEVNVVMEGAGVAEVLLNGRSISEKKQEKMSFSKKGKAMLKSRVVICILL